MNRTYGNISAKELIKLLENRDWMQALHDEFVKDYFVKLFYFLSGEEKNGKTILPPLDDVFRAFRLTPLNDVKIVILGQDPYPTLGDAHGLAFSVRKGVRIPRSLNNIYAELKSELLNGTLKPPKDGSDGNTFFTDGNLESWSRQGVLLLNTALTVNEGEPNSHQQKGWERFTDAAISALVKRNKPAVFILWGANAQKKKELIRSCLSESVHSDASFSKNSSPSEHHPLPNDSSAPNRDNSEISPSFRPSLSEICILESAHPSPLSARRGFFGSAPFSKANAFLRKHGLSPIEWVSPE